MINTAAQAICQRQPNHKLPNVCLRFICVLLSGPAWMHELQVFIRKEISRTLFLKRPQWHERFGSVPWSLRSWFGLSILRNNTLIHLHMIYKPICQPELWVRTDSSSHIDRDDLFPLCLSGEDGRFNRQLLRLLHRLLFLAADSYTFVWTLTVKRWAGPFTLTWDMCEG